MNESAAAELLGSLCFQRASDGRPGGERATKLHGRAMAGEAGAQGAAQCGLGFQRFHFGCGFRHDKAEGRARWALGVLGAMGPVPGAWSSIADDLLLR
jgi:hypothetical protein